MSNAKNIIEKEKMIDCHIHITPPEIIEDEKKYCKKDSYFDLLCSNPYNEFITAEELAQKTSELDLRKAIVFGFAFRDLSLCRQVNNYTISAAEKHPDKFTGFCVINPAAEGVVEELKRCRDAGLKGIGELFPAGQDFDITSIQDMETVCNFAAREEWPILIHINESIGHDYEGKTDISMEDAFELAENFPENKFIFAHWGGGLPFFELMPEVNETLKNVFYDTAAGPFLYKSEIYDTVESIGIIDKILLGSDYPLISPGRYRRRIAKSGLNKKDARKILWKNAESLL